MKKIVLTRSLLILVCCANSSQAAWSASCWYPNEVVAAQVKDFQYLLMVGTLRCRANHPATETSYNSFVNRHQGVLNSSALVLKAHFLREIGIVAGQQAYDQHTTLLSNRHSARQDAPSFCSTVDLYSRMATLASEQNFVTMARTAVDAPVSGPCNPAAEGVVVKPPELAVAPPLDAPAALAMGPPAAPAAVPAPPAAPAAAPAVVAAAPAAPAAAPGPGKILAAVPEPMIAAAAPAPAPVAPVVVPAGTVIIAEAPIVPPRPDTPTPAPRPDPVQALQEAVKALKAATDALSAQTATPI